MAIYYKYKNSEVPSGVPYYPKVKIQVSDDSVMASTILRREYEGMWYDLMIKDRSTGPAITEDGGVARFVDKFHKDVYEYGVLTVIDPKLELNGVLVYKLSSRPYLSEYDRLRPTNPPKNVLYKNEGPVYLSVAGKKIQHRKFYAGDRVKYCDLDCEVITMKKENLFNVYDFNWVLLEYAGKSKLVDLGGGVGINVFVPSCDSKLVLVERYKSDDIDYKAYYPDGENGGAYMPLCGSKIENRKFKRGEKVIYGGAYCEVNYSERDITIMDDIDLWVGIGPDKEVDGQVDLGAGKGKCVFVPACDSELVSAETPCYDDQLRESDKNSNIEDRMHIEKIIKTIRESFDMASVVYTSGSCYQFALILKAIYPKGRILTDQSHAIFELSEGYCYDINGLAKKTENHMPLEDMGISYINDVLKLRFDGELDSDKKRSLLENFITYYNALPFVKKGKDGLVTINYVNDYLTGKL